MTSRILKICSGLALLSAMTLSSLASAQSIDEVLAEARSVRAAEQALFQQRVAEFNAMSDAAKQQANQQNAANRAAISAQVQTKTDQFSANDLEISRLATELRDKANL